MWTNTPGDCSQSADAKLLRDEYVALSDPGTCTDKRQPLTIGMAHSAATLAKCLHLCDATSTENPSDRCEMVRYNYHSHKCALMRDCRERYSLRAGQCLKWWLLRPYDMAVMARLFPGRDPRNASASQHCYFTRQSTESDGVEYRRQRRNRRVWQDSQSLRADMLRQVPASSVCSATSLMGNQSGLVINATWNKVWRYYTALECGEPSAARICLFFKKMGKAAVLGGLNSTDGLHFGDASTILRLETPWTENLFTHNVAILRDGGKQSYAMMGGMQGFVSNTTCRLRHPEHTRSACLQLEPTTGVRLSRGTGFPWSAERWSPPAAVLSGAAPAGCVDRRPRYTGFPRLHACEFDGRLSAVRARQGVYLLYARANLQFDVVAGGRFVQVSRSARLDGSWAAWQPVQIAGVDPTKIDIYTFAVQRSPLEDGTLLAIFPMSEPPWACVAFAVSKDGVRFSRPVTLRNGQLGVRINDRGTLEWRGEDHPAAGAVRAIDDPGTIIVYIHHAVKGTTTRENAVPHVRAYKLDAVELVRQTSRGLRELRESSGQ